MMYHFKRVLKGDYLRLRARNAFMEIDQAKINQERKHYNERINDLQQRLKEEKTYVENIQAENMELLTRITDLQDELEQHKYWLHMLQSYPHLVDSEKKLEV